MARRSPDLPVWRAFGAALGAFALGVQLLLSGFLIGHVAVAADQSEFSVICSHDAGVSYPDGGIPSGPRSHDQCPACACPHSAKLLAPPPASPVLAILRPRGEALVAATDYVATEPTFHSPYAPRAPPLSG